MVLYLFSKENYTKIERCPLILLAKIILDARAPLVEVL